MFRNSLTSQALVRRIVRHTPELPTDRRPRVPPMSGDDDRMFRVLDVDAAVPTTPLAPDSVLQGAPEAGSRALAAVSGVEVGVWEMSPGTATDVEVDEVFVVLSGSATVRFEDGEQVELSPGTVVRLRSGEQTTWVVRETLRKIYVA
jgi:uncharacterized cupin superfamily protein